MAGMPRVANPAIPEDLDVFAEGLGINRASLAILLALSSGRPTTFAYIVERTGLPVATISRHLGRLERIGWVQGSAPRNARMGTRGMTWHIITPAIHESLDAVRNRFPGPSL